MIIVSVQLLSAIDSSHQELARMEICNMGTGTATLGNYSAETLRGRSSRDFARRTRQRIAYVNGHPRQREHVWNLVAKALRNLRYGGDWAAAEQIEICGKEGIEIMIAQEDLETRCTRIADQAVPEYRAPDATHTGCGSHTAKRWQAAWDGACIALGGDPADFIRS